MARVAANQDRAEAARAHFVYLQHARVQSRKGGTVMCEEVTDTRIAPSAHGQVRTLISLSGQVRDGRRTVHYTAVPLPAASKDQPQGRQLQKENDNDNISINVGDKRTVLDAGANNAPVPVNDTDIDLVESMRHNFTADSKSKDGIQAGLFPLTTEQQKDLAFELRGHESKNGHDTYHIVFRPKDKSDYGWKGDAWIDAEQLQPVVVRTALSRSLPVGVRMLLGTNVPGLGFTVIYAPQAGNVCFPASFGTEFKIRVLFLFHRQIVVSVDNRAFEQTHVTTTVHTDEAQPIPPPASPR